ncbi:MAG: SusF/SusE family outer membrane protein [Draconibacterium sp.]|nr:SusF/SusE family outer membrane protein [Draconibacterium sp.]
MKKITIYRFMAYLFVASIFVASCTKEMSDVRLEPTLSTSETFNITSDSATVVGFVVAQGDGFNEKGVCYNTSEIPTVDNSKVVYTKNEPTATFNVILSGLDYATKYYARAYATNEAGDVVYGEEVTFTTLPVVAILTTTAITDITGNSALGGGNVTVTGGAEVTGRGIVFGMNHNPTVSDSKTADGEGAGEFESTLSELKGNTKYYVRAYATNSAGIGYGPEVSFTTLVDLPIVTTTEVTDVTKISAVSGGDVTYDGGGSVTARGLVWSMNSEPTIDDNKIDGGSGVGTFVSTLENLEKFVTYHVRAFATNSAGTAYGDDIQFTTLADILTWNIPGDYVEASYPGSGLANWSPDKSPQVISTIDSPDQLEGYVYMANANNSWKFATQPNWDGPNYGDGGGGNLDPDGGNMGSPAGYYKLNADAAAMTFTAVSTVWGVIGSASPLGWDDETSLTFNPASGTWQGVMHLTAEEIKFRANHDWGYNYGSDGADGNLGAGAANIPVDVESDYSVEMNLGTPNNYTYAVNRWGLIGDAQGSWSDDANMTWDDVNGVFTATLDLVSSGSFKFRANDDWAINYGGDLNNLERDGANVTIESDGNYTVTFDPWGLKATVTKN